MDVLAYKASKQPTHMMFGNKGATKKSTLRIFGAPDAFPETNSKPTPENGPAESQKATCHIFQPSIFQVLAVSF